MIFWQVRDIEPVKEEEAESSYQENRDGDSLIQVLKDHKVILLYIIGMGLYGAAYQQYGYLMPLDMGRLHGENGAVIFGSVSSLNCVVVVLFTPLFTRIFAKMTHTKKSLLGQVMLLVGYAVFLLMLGNIPAYYVAITLFTFGEILTTIVNGPYLTARIPASHRGRMNGFMTVVQSVLQGTFLYVVGVFYDNLGSTAAWVLVIGVLLLAILLGTILIVCDKKKYHELYE